MDVEAALSAAEAELAAGRSPDLRALGFWRAVAAVKRDAALLARHADRIAAIDRAAFRRATPLRTDAALGAVLLGLVTAAALLLLGLAPSFDRPWLEIAVLVAAGAIDASTHGLAHFFVGSAVRMRFTDWFVDLPKPPGFKVDYASYLRASPGARAWMHASGAIVTKLVPFLAALYALAVGAETWAVALLLALGVVQVASDVLFSRKASDWKKVRREMRLTSSRASRTSA
jgi:hypothetical protein